MNFNQKVAILLGCFLCFSSTVMAQAILQTVQGQVIDSETSEPLDGVTVQILGSDPAVGAITDADGVFTFPEVPIGRASFFFSYVGYEDNVISEILIGSAKQVQLVVKLNEALEELNEVVLVASKNDLRKNSTWSTVSSQSFSVEETKRFPASISDPGRMALSFAGVTNSDDETNEIIIRGNAPNQLLWRVEGMEVPEPNHFSEEGYSPGAVSLLSTNVLGASTFSTGAFSAIYGNALSGVFDIYLRNGNANRGEYTFQFGVLGADITAEGPFSKNYRGSYLVNYRYSTLSLLNQVVEISEGGIPTYQDLSFKVNLPIGSSTNLSVWGIGGISDDDQDAEESGGFVRKEDFESTTYMTGATLSHLFQDKSKLAMRLSFSGNSSDFVFRRRDVSNDQISGNTDILENNAIRFGLDYTKKLNARATFKTGAIMSLLQYNVASSFLENEITTTTVNEEGDGSMFQGHAQLKYRFNSQFSATAGFHATSFSVNEDLTIEPRVGLEYKINPKHTLSGGFGIHSRRMPLNQYFVRVQNGTSFTTPNTNLDLMQATHYILGYDWKLMKKGHLKMEVYYQDLQKVAISKDPLLTDSYLNGRFINAELTDVGEGRNYGLELTWEKFFADQYYFLTTASIYDSQYRAADGNWYDSRYNYNYTFNIVGGKEFTVGQHNIFGVNAKFLFNGGKRGSGLDQVLFNQTGEVAVDQLTRNTIQYDPYYRIDISASYRMNRPKVSHILSLDIQNVTDRSNVDGQFFNPNTASLQNTFQLGIVPFVNYKIEF